MPAAVTVLAAVALLAISLIHAGSAQSIRRVSDIAVGGLHVCRDAARIQLARDDLGFGDPTVDVTGAFQPPESQTNSAFAPDTFTLQNRHIDYVPNEDPADVPDPNDPFDSTLVPFDLTGTFTLRWNRQLATGLKVRLYFGNLFNGPRGDLGGADGVDDCRIPSLSSSSRMVGKGSVSSGGQTAAYAYILNCTAAPNAGAPFEVRFNGQRFSMSSVDGVSCADYTNVVTPPAGFDTQTGNATGTIGGTPAKIEWTAVDGGLGGANDRFRLRIRKAGPVVFGERTFPVVFEGSAAPPGKFPGSTQLTGFNTAQRP